MCALCELPKPSGVNLLLVRIIAGDISKRSPLPPSTSAQRGRCRRVADSVGTQRGRRAGGGDVEQLLRPFLAGTLPQGR